MQFRDPSRANYRGHAAQPAASTQPQNHPQATAQNAKRRRGGVRAFFKRRWWQVLLVVAVAGLIFLSYGYVHTKNQLNKLSNPKTAGQTELQQIINQVSKAIDLPAGETPTLATVNDASKLKSQTFFRNAQNGDKVLIYTKAGRALLYRPFNKRVIEYAPVNLGANQAQ